MSDVCLATVAIGDACVEEAKCLIASLNENAPGAKFCVVSDMPIHKNTMLARAYKQHYANGSRRWKTSHYFWTDDEIVVYMDSDCLLLKPLDLSRLLPDNALIAMPYDHGGNKVSDARLLCESGAWGNRDEYCYTVDTCGEEFPHYSTGVMAWRRCDQVAYLMSEWMREWQRYGTVDQLAMCRALKRAGIEPHVLGNDVVGHDPSDDCMILHNFKNRVDQQKFLGEKLCGTVPYEDEMLMSYNKAVRKGLMHRDHYHAILSMLMSFNKPINMLVFGAGNDTELWKSVVGKGLTVIEDDEFWFKHAVSLGVEAIRVEYLGKRGDYNVGVTVHDKQGFDRLFQRHWDVVLVDGPTAWNADCSGRDSPIAIANMIMCSQRATVIVHDYDRPHEWVVCNRTLGEPQIVVSKDGWQVAFWGVSWQQASPMFR